MKLRKYVASILALRILFVALGGFLFGFSISQFTLVYFVVLSTPALRFLVLRGVSTDEIVPPALSREHVGVLALGVPVILILALVLNAILEQSTIFGSALAALLLLGQYAIAWYRLRQPPRIAV